MKKFWWHQSMMSYRVNTIICDAILWEHSSLWYHSKRTQQSVISPYKITFIVFDVILWEHISLWCHHVVSFYDLREHNSMWCHPMREHNSLQCHPVRTQWYVMSLCPRSESEMLFIAPCMWITTITSQFWSLCSLRIASQITVKKIWPNSWTNLQNIRKTLFSISLT